MPRRTTAHVPKERQPDHMVNTGTIVGVQEGAAYFNVNPATFSNWAIQRASNKMPLPVMVFSSGTFYDLVDLVPWWEDWIPVRGRKTGEITAPLESREVVR